MILGGWKSRYYRLAVRCFSNQSVPETSRWTGESLEALRTAIDPTVTYQVHRVALEPVRAKHKWVGGQYYRGKVYGIPNDAEQVLCYASSASYVGSVPAGLFKWTGGCVWDNAVYGFPRTASSFLRLDADGVREIPLTLTYEKEHHYGGVCTKDGVVYQPPRDTNHILKTDLKTGLSAKIDIVDAKFHVPFRYCGSILHPNGFIYFFPERNCRVIKLDPGTDQWCFIGKKVSTMCFNAKVGLDGNIYGYSAYCSGIMKIDVRADSVEMIHEEVYPGAYGTKYGGDGCLYSVPGDGSAIYRFDVERDRVEVFFDLQDETKAKYAGGATLPDGRIVCIPAEENSLLILEPDKNLELPNGVVQTIFADYY